MWWSRAGSGKRGGLRLIYDFDSESESFYLLYVYPKSARDELTPRQLQILAHLVREEFL